MQPLKNGCIVGVDQDEFGGLVERDEQMAEHVAGTAVVIVRHRIVVASRAVTAMVLRATERKDLLIMRSLTRRRLPTERRRKHGRQQDGEQCRSDIPEGAAHGGILAYLAGAVSAAVRLSPIGHLRGSLPATAASSAATVLCPARPSRRGSRVAVDRFAGDILISMTSLRRFVARLLVVALLTNLVGLSAVMFDVQSDSQSHAGAAVASDGGSHGDDPSRNDCNHGCHAAHHFVADVSNSALRLPEVTAARSAGRSPALPKFCTETPLRPPRALV